MAIEFPKLPFELDALEPHISRETIEYHYGKHHKKYVETLNELIKGTRFDEYKLKDIMCDACGKKPKIFNNASQAWSHEFMWNSFKRDSEKPSANLNKIISKRFGSFDLFKERFEKRAKDLFGSGWVWLVKDRKGHLQIRAFNNAENPIPNGDVPLFTCDVWEHAYYLDYQNERPEYVESYWNVINWQFVEANLDRQHYTPTHDRVEPRPHAGPGLQVH